MPKGQEIIFIVSRYLHFLSNCLLRGFLHMILMYKEKASWELHKNPTSYLEQFLEATPHEITATYLPSQKPSQ